MLENLTKKFFFNTYCVEKDQNSDKIRHKSHRPKGVPGDYMFFYSCKKCARKFLFESDFQRHSYNKDCEA